MKARHSTAFATLGFALSAGCAAHSNTMSAESPPETPPAVGETEPSPVAAEQVQQPPAAAAELVFALEQQGLSKPESILYLEDQDVYFISNVNGEPLGKDENGFISKVSPEGRVLELRFIDGEKPGVNLDAPKGMALSDGTLYVADINWIRMFDPKSGASKGSIAVPGATFLNDVTRDAEGAIYVSDTGWKLGKAGAGYAKSGSDTVYRVDPKKGVAVAMAKDEKWGNPNGLTFASGGLWAVSDEGELYQVTSEGKLQHATNLAKGGLDGLVALDDGTFLVSSWEGGAIYRGKPGGEFARIISGVASPGDIGYDRKRQTLLVPSMVDDRLLAFKLEDGDAEAVAPAPAQTLSSQGANLETDSTVGEPPVAEAKAEQRTLKENEASSTPPRAGASSEPGATASPQASSSAQPRSSNPPPSGAARKTN